MAITIPEYEQQLKDRATQIQDIQKQVESFDPRVAQTQMQLRQATPQSQLRVRDLEYQRQQAKTQAGQNISQI